MGHDRGRPRAGRHPEDRLPHPRTLLRDRRRADRGLHVAGRGRRTCAPATTCAACRTSRRASAPRSEMRRRIFAAGMRPINAIVDATQLRHARDGTAYPRLRRRESTRRHRRAAGEPGEKITLLDGTTRALDEDMLVIADEERGLVIAGVMGAEDAEVGDETDRRPDRGRHLRRSQYHRDFPGLGLRTDASGASSAASTRTWSLSRWTGSRSLDAGRRRAGRPRYPQPLPRACRALGGAAAPRAGGTPARHACGAGARQRKARGAGMRVRGEDGRISATVPTFRRDLRREADLIEEVGRLIGLDRCPKSCRRLRSRAALQRSSTRSGCSGVCSRTSGSRRRSPTRSARTAGTEISASRWRRSPADEPAERARRATCAPCSCPALLDAAARNAAFGAGARRYLRGWTRLRGSASARRAARDAALEFRLTGETGPARHGRGATAHPSLWAWRENQRVGVVLAGTIARRMERPCASGPVSSRPRA